MKLFLTNLLTIDVILNVVSKEQQAVYDSHLMMKRSMSKNIIVVKEVNTFLSR